MEDDGAYSSQNDIDRDYRRGDRRDRGAGRRRERKPRDRLRRERDRPDRQEFGEGSDLQTPPMKTPIILAKKTTSDVNKKEAPTILAIQRRGGYDGSPSPSSSKSLFTETYNKPSRTDKNGGSASPATPTQTPQTTPHSKNIDTQVVTGLAALKLPPDIYPAESISLIDGGFQWSDRAFDTLIDQSDYVVVGCVGLQGAGKSTIMSMIAGQKIESMEKTRLVFRPQKKSDLEKCIHRTVGIDIYVTRARMILLDTQPLLSPSMLDQYLRYDRKVPAEYSTAELCLEVQALQILSFLYTVCHVVLVVQDYFTDLNLLNLLKSAEMLKPSTVSHGNQDSTSVNADELNEYFPHICFLYTCCEGRTFEANMVRSMCEIHAKYFKASRLRIRGGASVIRSSILPYHSLRQFEDYHDLNLFLLPQMNESAGTEAEDDCPISTFRGHPSLQSLIKVLRHQLLAMPRDQFTHHQLSERNWFHFAARTWEAVKKSNLIGEYHRLLTA